MSFVSRGRFTPFINATGLPLAQNKKVGRISLQLIMIIAIVQNVKILLIAIQLGDSHIHYFSYCRKGFNSSMLSQHALAKTNVSSASTNESLILLRYDSAAIHGPDHLL